MKIAVYGSIKKGKHNHRWLEGAEMLGETTVRGTMYLVSGSYPVLMEDVSMFEDEGEHEYVAEVYDVPEDVYERIKRIEIGAGYTVRKVDTEFGEAVVFYGTDSFNDDIKNGIIKRINEY